MVKRKGEEVVEKDEDQKAENIGEDPEEGVDQRATVNAEAVEKALGINDEVVVVRKSPRARAFVNQQVVITDGSRLQGSQDRSQANHEARE